MRNPASVGVVTGLGCPRALVRAGVQPVGDGDAKRRVPGASSRRASLGQCAPLHPGWRLVVREVGGNQCGGRREPCRSAGARAEVSKQSQCRTAPMVPRTIILVFSRAAGKSAGDDQRSTTVSGEVFAATAGLRSGTGGRPQRAGAQFSFIPSRSNGCASSRRSSSPACISSAQSRRAHLFRR